MTLDELEGYQGKELRPPLILVEGHYRVDQSDHQHDLLGNGEMRINTPTHCFQSFNLHKLLKIEKEQQHTAINTKMGENSLEKAVK